MSDQYFQFESGPHHRTIAKVLFLVTLFIIIPATLIYLLNQYTY